uniref:THIF-type NAD/FAD binding fold domain-containing protein n=2 Tax=Clastoptera arizonana TaxID=38151 RepID=A0A1B6CFJ2_9HEMI
MVDVKVDEGNIKSKNDEFFASFDVILATDCNLHSLLYLNSLCRKYSIKFFCADVFGSYGYIFTDLQNHVYAEEQKMKSKQEKLTVKKTIIYESLKSSLEIDWSTEKSVKKLKKMDSTYFLIRILLNFRNKVRRNPSPLHEVEDMQLLQQLRQKTLKSLKVENIIHIEDKDLQMVFSQLSPICAIIGGVLAQEVIKALSQHGEPYKNLFLFNPNNLVGQVINLEKN